MLAGLQARPQCVTHLAGLCLPNHALGHGARLQGIIQAQAADVRVGSDALDPRQVPHFRGHLDPVRHAPAAWIASTGVSAGA
jgi:hypothetical protein